MIIWHEHFVLFPFCRFGRIQKKKIERRKPNKNKENTIRWLAKSVSFSSSAFVMLQYFDADDLYLLLPIPVLIFRQLFCFAVSYSAMWMNCLASIFKTPAVPERKVLRPIEVKLWHSVSHTMTTKLKEKIKLYRYTSTTWHIPAHIYKKKTIFA